jgi:hypothetical protein
MRTQRFDGRPRELDAVSRVVAAILIVAALLIAAYAGIYYAAAYDKSKALSKAQLQSSLPANYRETFRSLVIFGGHPCREVCDIDPIDASAGKTTLEVRCSAANAATPCSTTNTFALAIELAPEPSR